MKIILLSSVVSFSSFFYLHAHAEYTLNDHLKVYPPEIGSKKSFEIAEIIELFMQPKGNYYFPWDYMSDSNITWITDGIDSNFNGDSYRVGALRINILGDISTILKNKVYELGWLVEYSTKKSPKWGAEMVSLKPGGNSGDFICFGSRFTQCDFDIKNSLESSNLELERICEASSFKYSDVYRITKNGKEALIATLNTDGGSGGASSELILEVDKGDIAQKSRCSSRY